MEFNKFLLYLYELLDSINLNGESILGGILTIIDTHMHFGDTPFFHMPEEAVLLAKNEYNIDMAILSNVACCEFDAQMSPRGEAQSAGQIRLNEETVRFVERNEGFLGQFWIMPHFQKLTNEVCDFILAHRDSFRGIKTHPFYSNLPITDSRYLPYLDFASQTGLSVAVHTAGDDKSAPWMVGNVARKFPHAAFILVHMGLCTDNQEAIEVCAQEPNVYGDTTWVPFDNVVEAVRRCGAEKILFGTDAPIDGADTCKWYEAHLTRLSDTVGQEAADLVLYRNAQRIFSI